MKRDDEREREEWSEWKRGKRENVNKEKRNKSETVPRININCTKQMKIRSTKTLQIVLDSIPGDSFPI